MTDSKRGRVYLVEEERGSAFFWSFPHCPEGYVWEEVEGLELNDGRTVYMLVNDQLDEMEHDRQGEFIEELRKLGYDARTDVDVPLS